MKKLTFILLFFLLSSISLFGQNDSVQKNKNCYEKNTMFIEFLGNGGFYSLNYDRIINEKKNHKVSIRGGISLSSLTNWISSDENITEPMSLPGNLFKNYFGDESYNKSLILPIEINYLLGKKYFFEIGGGLTGDIHLIKNIYGSRLYLFTRILGFRYQKENGGFFFRAGLVPSFKIFLYKNEFLFDPWRYYFSYISVDIGYTFKNEYKNEK
ncbi:MAG: hypothetical protein PHD97_03950 [Bacteroidales bacterium]|nr:hypothetical protein [Bacteroidales bacterium]